MQSKPLAIALIQMASTDQESENLAAMTRMMDEAVHKKATWILLPELFHYRAQGGLSDKLVHMHAIDGPMIQNLQTYARTHQVAILAGSFLEKTVVPGKAYNTSVLISDTGALIGIYRKLHLFDAIVAGKHIDESKTFLVGTEPCLAQLFGQKLGLSICYDLRFPELYRHYARLGAKFLCVPSSFTKPTGIAHWEILCRARAIENQAYVLAPNQAGIGASGVPSYGNSMIIDPWGRILARADESESVIMAQIDLSQNTEHSTLNPLNHQRRDLF